MAKPEWKKIEKKVEVALPILGVPVPRVGHFAGVAHRVNVPAGGMRVVVRAVVRVVDRAVVRAVVGAVVGAVVRAAVRAVIRVIVRESCGRGQPRQRT